MLVGLDSGEVGLYLDLYKFCNDWNYFNIGDEIFKQDKGVSMGCYYSKEISELVLLYAEYKYQLVSEMNKIEFLGRYADDGLMIFSTCEDFYVIHEMKKLMLFYLSNLIINVTVNRAVCNFLDLCLALDDISETYGKIHFYTYFNKFHTFSYLDPMSNHPPFVFKGLVKTECIRYFRNSLLFEDYMRTLNLFKMRQQKLGYNHAFTDRETLSFEEVRRYIVSARERKDFLKDNVLIPILHNRRNDILRQTNFFLRKAMRGMPMAHSISLVYKVLPKLRNIISTARILHHKLRGIRFRKPEIA